MDRKLDNFNQTITCGECVYYFPNMTEQKTSPNFNSCIKKEEISGGAIFVRRDDGCPFGRKIHNLQTKKERNY